MSTRRRLFTRWVWDDSAHPLFLIWQPSPNRSLGPGLVPTRESMDDHTLGPWPKPWPQAGPSASRETHRLLGDLTTGARLITLKIRYKGKSFRWLRRAGSLVLRFGRSHASFVRFGTHVKRRKLGRMSLILFGFGRSELFFLGRLIVRQRRMNIYHRRGLRLARQTVFRKDGKVSIYR